MQRSYPGFSGIPSSFSELVMGRVGSGALSSLRGDRSLADREPGICTRIDLTQSDQR